MFLAQFEPTLWELALEVEEKWMSGTINGQPKKGEPVKQSSLA